MDAYTLAVTILICVSAFFGVLAIMAKYLWHDKTKTQIFVFIAVIATILFMILVYPTLPD